MNRTHGPEGRSGEEDRMEVESASQSPGAILAGKEPCLEVNVGDRSQPGK